MGLIDARSPSCSSSTASRCSASASPPGPRPVQPPERSARGSRPISTRCPSGTRPSRRRPSTPRPSRCTRSRSGRWHVPFSWGGAERLAAADPEPQRLYMNHATAAVPRHRRGRLGLGHQPPRPGRPGRADGRRPPDTVWTWNAIGKRKGAWGLEPTRRRRRRASCSTTLIDDLLPARDGGYRYANADPVTGQAAWYDLRSHREAAAEDAASDAAPGERCRRPPAATPPPATTSPTR
jgi:hypothetical protein